jgi:hypothetical protein
MGIPSLIKRSLRYLGIPFLSSEAGRKYAEIKKKRAIKKALLIEKKVPSTKLLICGMLLSTKG